MGEELSQYEKEHPSAAMKRVKKEIARVKEMSPESEEFFGKKEVHLDRLNRKLKAIKDYIKNEYGGDKPTTVKSTAEEKAEQRKRLEKYFE